MAIDHKATKYDEIHFYVNGQQLLYDDSLSTGNILANTRGSYAVVCRLDEEWDYYDVVYLVVLSKDGRFKEPMLPCNNGEERCWTCPMPDGALLSTGIINVGLIGYKSTDKAVRYPTTRNSSISVGDAIDIIDESDDPAVPPSQTEEMATNIASLLKRTSELEQLVSVLCTMSL